MNGRNETKDLIPVLERFLNKLKSLSPIAYKIIEKAMPPKIMDRENMLQKTIFSKT